VFYDRGDHSKKSINCSEGDLPEKTEEQLVKHILNLKKIFGLSITDVRKLAFETD
jgi:hypothetical protein